MFRVLRVESFVTMPKAEEGENDHALASSLDVGTLFGVAGKVVLITGGGSGIGAMIASGYVQNGARVYIASRKDCTPYAQQLTAKGPGTCAALASDISVPAQQEALIAAVEKAEGKLHVLINNSGTNLNVKLEKHTPDVFSKVMQLNADAVFSMCRLAAPLLQKSSTKADPGRIINISSVNGLEPPVIDNFGYSASKAAVVMLGRHLAGALGRKHVTVNTICPGPFLSRMTRGTIRAIGEEKFAPTAVGRMGQAADIAGACLFLSGIGGAFTTGATFPVDGGAIVARPKL